LVDAYCGSGLFSITCSKGFQSVVGVEISADSVKYAKLNAEANRIENTTFLTGSAEKIFELVQTPPDQTAMIIDPPRKVKCFFCVDLTK
jgi:tRNA (uracil-5-)-methyltransferase